MTAHPSLWAPAMSSSPDASFSLESLRSRRLTSETAWSLALASRLADGDAATAGDTLSAWGFEAGELFHGGDGPGYLATAGEVVLLAFGSRQPAVPWPGAETVIRPFGQVHAVAWNAFTAVEGTIRTALGILGAKGKPLWIAGHGTGGSLAVLAASELDAEYPVAGVYTYFSACVGKFDFADRFDAKFLGRSFRFEASMDQVFAVPPGFRHVQMLVRLDLGDATEEGAEDPPAPSIDRCLDRLRTQAAAERLKRIGTPKPETMPP